MVTAFFLMGIPHTTELEKLLFVLFMAFSLLTLPGNLLILLAVVTSSSFHTHLYFFLESLLVLDIFCPLLSSQRKMLYLTGHSHIISYQGCALGSSSIISWAVLMAYNPLAVICQPLRYTVIMSSRDYASMTVATWI